MKLMAQRILRSRIIKFCQASNLNCGNFVYTGKQEIKEFRLRILLPNNSFFVRSLTRVDLEKVLSYLRPKMIHPIASDSKHSKSKSISTNLLRKLSRIWQLVLEMSGSISNTEASYRIEASTKHDNNNNNNHIICI